MTEGIADIQTRIAQIQALINPSGGTATTSSTSGTQFAQALSDASGDSSTGTDTDLADKVITTAKKYLGVPYRWGGTDPNTGLDCSGLTQLVYKQVGVDLPRVSGDQAQAGTEVASMKDAQPGDLVFFGSPVHHVGIYLGDGQMLDAPHTGTDVQIRKVYETPSHIRRVLPATSSASPSALSGLTGLSGLSLGTQSLTSGSGTGSLAGTPYAELFTQAGNRYGVDPSLLSAIAKQESSYNPSAVSPAGARGLMQLMPGTASSLGVDPDNPTQAANGAARLMADHLRSFNGRVDLALAAYNAGPGAVRKYNGVPPYDETQNYVQRVTSNWKDLR